MKTVRFWTYHHGSLVKISLRDGQRATLIEGGPTDEGWSSRSNSYQRSGFTVTLTWGSDGADCDGRLTTGGITVANIFALHRQYVEDELLAGTILAEHYGPRTMPWRQVEDYPVYDQYAQAMGY